MAVRTELVKARVEPELKTELERLAETNGVSVSVIVRWALEDYARARAGAVEADRRV